MVRKRLLVPNHIRLTPSRSPSRRSLLVFFLSLLLVYSLVALLFYRNFAFVSARHSNQHTWQHTWKRRIIPGAVHRHYFSLHPPWWSLHSSQTLREELSFFSSGIPRLLHQTYSAAHRLSPLAQNLMGTFRVNHPAWTVAFWDDAAARKFVYARYPRYADVYSQLKRPVMRADMLRYMLMDAYGGVYADVDVESVQPLERLLDVGGIAGTASCVVSPEPRAHGAILEGLPHRAMVSNAVFASKPGHALWRMALQMIQRDIENGAQENDSENDPVSITGPRLLSKVYHQLRNRPNVDEQCTMLPVEVLNPAADAGAIGDNIKNICEVFLHNGTHTDKPYMSAEALAERKQECELLRGRGYVQAPRDNVASYTAHHWVHTWIPGYQPHSSVGDTFRSAVPIAQYDMTVLSDTDLRSRMADVGVNLPDAPPLPKSSVLTNHTALENSFG